MGNTHTQRKQRDTPRPSKINVSKGDNKKIHTLRHSALRVHAPESFRPDVRCRHRVIC